MIEHKGMESSGFGGGRGEPRALGHRRKSHSATTKTRPASPQEAVCEFLLAIVKTKAPDVVMTEFQRLFMLHMQADEGAVEGLSEIVLANQEQEFGNLLRRACYILINNWDMARHQGYIPQLIRVFDDLNLEEPTDIFLLGRLRLWLRNFMSSPEFDSLKLVTARYEERGTGHWSRRYTSYLLAPQYANAENSPEQRQVAQKVSRQLKDQFKFDLAMYTARSECIHIKSSELRNPTSLGDEVLRLVKKVVVKRGSYSYPNLATLFLSQTQALPYQAFKSSLLEYLFFGIAADEFALELRSRLTEQLKTLYVSHDDKVMDEALLLRTVKRLIECLTTEKSGEPSALFILLSSQKNPLVLVILLLKLTLICRFVKTHLEVCIAHVVKYYEDYQEQDCAWVIQFLELFTIVLTIYSENVEYNLVTMPHQAEESGAAERRSLGEGQRIFSLQRGGRSPREEESDIDLEPIIAPISL
jgi:hypothetical protein